MPLNTDAIWLPGAGMTSISEQQVARAVEEYDADMTLGYRMDTGEWCVFLPGNQASGGQPFPVFTFGDRLPHPDHVKAELHRHDIRRNGRQILDDLDRLYAEEQAAYDKKAQEASEQLAEVIDSNMRMNGAHPFPRVFVGRSKYGGDRVRSSG